METFWNEITYNPEDTAERIRIGTASFSIDTAITKSPPKIGREVLMKGAMLLRSRVMGNYQARF